MRPRHLTPFHGFTALFTVAMGVVAVGVPPRFCAPLLAAAALLYALVLTVGVFRPGLAFFLPTVARIAPGHGAVALTFDDGPDPSVTPAILRELARHGARATFFCVGQAVEKHPQLLREAVQAGHAIGNHTFHHRSTTNFMTARALHQEVVRTQNAVQRACGHTPRLFRSPMGLTNPRLGPVLRGTALTYTAWSVRSLDRRPRNVERVARRITRKLRDGTIVLLHDGGVDPDQATTILRAVLRAARRQGLRCLTVEEMLEGVAGQPAWKGDEP